MQPLSERTYYLEFYNYFALRILQRYNYFFRPKFKCYKYFIQGLQSNTLKNRKLKELNAIVSELDCTYL